MPRVHTKVKSARGRDYTCNRCGRVIKPGQVYRQWSFRYGGDRNIHGEEVREVGEDGTARVVCSGLPPRPSELTQSRMGEVYAAVEAYDDAGDDVEDKAAALEQLAEVAQEVAEAYREAAEAFGGAGENAERADELEPWAEDVAEKASALREAVDAIMNADEVAGSCPL